jgi:hypothetical protein
MGGCLSSPVADEGASRTKGGVHHTHPQAPNLPKSDPEPAEAEQENAIRQRQMHKRIAVAAQAITSASDVAIPNIPKTESARLLIGTLPMQAPSPTSPIPNPHPNLCTLIQNKP